jgi:hypothetical protein
MNKKLLSGIIAVLVVIGGYFLLTREAEEKTIAVHGYSVKDTEIEAVEEAVSMIKAKIAEPDYVILFSTVEDKALGRKGYNPETVLKEVNRLLPNTKVYGGTSQQGILTKDGYYQGDNAALAMLAVSSPRITFGVGGANIDDYASAKEAGKAAIQNAIKDAGKEGKYPQLILMTGSIGNEEEILAGIEDVIGWGIPVIGGSAGDNSIFSGIYREFANDKTYFNGVSLTAIFTDLKIGYAYEAGFDLKKEKGTITKAKGRVIYEINNRPAGEVLNEWCSGCLSEKIKTGGSTMPETLFLSLAKVIKTESGTYYLSVAVLGVNAEDKSLNTFANVMTGDEILLMEGDWRIYVEKAKMVSKKAMSSKGISKGESLFGIYTSCAGIRTGTPEQERPKIVSAVSEEIGKEVPFIGPFTFGEEGPLGLVNHHGNFINSLILFSEKK